MNCFSLQSDVHFMTHWKTFRFETKCIDFLVPGHRAARNNRGGPDGNDEEILINWEILEG